MCSTVFPANDAGTTPFSGYVGGILPQLPDDLVLDGVFMKACAINAHVFYLEHIAKNLQPDILAQVGLEPVEHFTGNGSQIVQRKHQLDGFLRH